MSSFLGSTTTGGFLQAANNALTGLTDPNTGVIQAGIASVADEAANDNQLITNDQARITTLQNNLNTQMAAADAAIAAMEQQYTYLSEMFSQMQTDAQTNG